MKEKIIVLLVSLGKTPDEVAKNLIANGIKGDIKSLHTSPIANYLRYNNIGTEEDEYLAVFYTDIAYERDSSDEDIIIEFKDYNELMAVKEFEEAFDKGKYPELIE